MTKTKRAILRVVMSLFDPLGFLCNCTVRAKILLQDVLRSGIGWAEKVAGRQLKKWTEWISFLLALSNVTVPMCYSLEMRHRVRVDLHLLCDASEQACAAVAYWRITTQDKTEVAFSMGKSRVAPLKPMSICRLELQAAVMGTRLAKSVYDGHKLGVDEMNFWTDSRTVLCRIRSDARNFKQFVSNRV